MLLDRSPYFPRFVQFHLSFSMCDAKWIILTIFTYIIIYQNQNVTDLYTVWFITLMKRTLEMSNGITIYSNSLSYYKNRLTFISRTNKNLWYPIWNRWKSSLTIFTLSRPMSRITIFTSNFKVCWSQSTLSKRGANMAQ